MNPYLAIVLLLVGSAFFSSAEIAYASANKSRMKKAAESGSQKGKWAVEMSDNYDKTLCTVLIGNNLVNIAASSVATVIAIALVGDAGVAVATGVMTVLLLIFGEILPKQLGKKFCDKYVLAISPVLRFMMLITKPLVFLFMKLAEQIAKLWAGTEDDTAMTYDDLVTLIETVEEEGVIDEDQSELLQSAIEFDETEVKEIITHRVDMVALDINDPADEIIGAAIESQYSRIPVYDDSIDNIIGILPVNHLLRELLSGETPDIRALLTEATFVPQSKKLPDVLEDMRREKSHIAIVTDEYGGTFGIVTMEDILEEIVGEIWDETDEIKNDIVRESDTVFYMDGGLMLSEFLEYIDVNDPELDDYIIPVGGWAIEVLEDYPEPGESFEYRDYIITVTEIDEFRVTKLRVEHMAKEEENED